MRKKRITIEEGKNSLGVYIITVYNARFHEHFLYNVKMIFNFFCVDEELFLGFYRTDGVNLTPKQYKAVENKISDFFQKYGNTQKLSEYLSVAKIKFNDENFDYIPEIFDYYFETVLFKPKIEWENYKLFHCNYMNNKIYDIILNNFSDALFYYFDSGDFSIYFNPEIYNRNDVKNIINELFS